MVLRELVDEGTPLPCNPRKIAPGMEMSSGHWDFQYYNTDTVTTSECAWFLTYLYIYSGRRIESFNTKKVAVALKQQGLGRN